jgi:hypothetical protein
MVGILHISLSHTGIERLEVSQVYSIYIQTVVASVSGLI